MPPFYLIRCSWFFSECVITLKGQHSSTDISYFYQNPDVKQWHIILIKVREVLECSDIERLKITVSEILRDYGSTR